MGQSPWDRFKTGQALHGRLLQELVDQAGAGAILAAGAHVGPWRIVELLGSGGMAHVYLAERADGRFEQQVALKLVRGNADLIDRLRHERRIVATLRHPHIVSLIDGGETDNGDLWFAMGVVDGVPVDVYAQERNLDLDARLELFDAVCGAIEYAHSRALIHRDIKPDNILVDNAGHPRLLDFGIALEHGESSGNLDHVMTPGYASPEQLAGQTLTVTSDVYQLGLVLEDLLLLNPDADETHWIAMPGGVRADLKKVIARATSQDPPARYATASALREDIANVQSRRPVAQDRASASMRLLRMVERHWVSFAVALVAIVTLASSLTVAALRLRDERNLAIANEQRANAVSEFLVGTLTQANPYAPQKGAVSVLEAMDHAAATLDQSLSESPALRRELRSTIGGIYLNLDEAQRCLDLLAADQAQADLQLASTTEQAQMMIMHSECHVALDHREEGWRWLEAAQQVLRDEPSLRADQLRAFILVDRGQLLSLNGKLIEANQALEQALALAVSSGSEEQEYRAKRMLGNNLQQSGDNARAAELLQSARDLAARTLGPAHRSTLTTAGSLAISQGKLGQWVQAESTIESALAAAESVRHRGASPDIVIAQLRDNYANLLWQQGHFDRCLVQARAALEIYQRMAPAASSQGFNPSWRVAACAYQQHNWELAAEYAAMALHYGENGVPVGVINALRMLAAVAARRDQPALAADYLRRADAALATTEVANKAVYSALHLTRALLAVRSGDLAAARAYLQQAEASIEQSGLNPSWLAQERDEVAAMIAAKP